MNRKDYQTPMMKVVQLRHAGMLMTSGVQANRSGYGEAQQDTWDDPASSRRGKNVWDNEEEQD